MIVILKSEATSENALTVPKKMGKKFTKMLDIMIYHFAKPFVEILHRF